MQHPPCLPCVFITKAGRLIPFILLLDLSLADMTGKNALALQNSRMLIQDTDFSMLHSRQ